MAARSARVRWMRLPRVGAVASLVTCLAVSITSCNDPNAPAAPSGDSPAYVGNFDGARLEFRIEAPGGSASGLSLVAQSLDFDSETRLLHAQVAVRNDGSSAVLGPESIVVFGFVPTDVVPQNATCSDGNPSFPHPHCAFDHRGTYGDTGLLEPGASSTPIEWILLVPSGESFAFRAQLGAPEPGPGAIAGVVFADTDLDGWRDPAETGIQDIEVRLHFGARLISTRSDARGRYAFTVGEAGFYELTIEVPPRAAVTTPLPLRVAILRRADGSLSSFTLGDIGLAQAGVGSFVRLQGLAYNDLNRNGIYDEGEPGIPGVGVRGEACADEEDDDSKSAPVRTADDFETVTDAEGRWVLLLPDCGGPWSVRGGSIDGYDRTSPKTVVFYAVSPGEVLIADFGYAPEDASSRYEVRGVVFLDHNRSGFRDPYEPGVPGVLVTADGLQCERLGVASDVTDSKGRYEIEGDEIACPLPWRLERGPIAGLRATTPPVVEIAAPPAAGGKLVVDFGVAPPPAVSAATGPASTTDVGSR